MLKRQVSVMAAMAILATQAGCYTTRIVTARPPEGPAYTDRQWFTVGGLAGLSQPAGQHCQNGLSYAESKLSGTDWLINVGLSVAGGIAGALACGGGNNGDPVVQSSCISIGASLVPFLLSSRTVEYACAAGGPGPQQPWMPQQQHNPQQYNQQPPPPPPGQPSAPPPSAP